MTLGELVAEVRADHDAASDRVELWANERYRRMVAESLWRMVVRPVGSTVAGQASYPIDAAMLDLRRVLVDGADYLLAGADAMADLVAGRSRVRGAAGAFAATADGDGDPELQLWPVPSVDGLEIRGSMAFQPDALGSNDAPLIPAHLHSYWLDGVIADAYVKLDGRWDLAQAHEARFELGIDRLRRLRNSRIGGGPVQAQVQGYHFR